MHEGVIKAIPDSIEDQIASPGLIEHSILAFLSDHSSNIQSPVCLSKLASKFGLCPQDLFQRLLAISHSGVEFKQLDQEVCQLREALDLLQPRKIQAGINAAAQDCIQNFELFPVTTSTNDRLMDLPAGERHGQVFLTEYQTAGRGRYGKHWLVPYAAGLCFSLGWDLPGSIENTQLVSLLPGVALMRFMQKLGLEYKAGLKWPNDLLVEGRKLAGVLTEITVSNENPNQTSVVIGVGVNVYASMGHIAIMSKVKQPWLALSNLPMGNSIPTRNELASFLINELTHLLQNVEAVGLSPLLQEWKRYDLAHDRSVKLIFPNHTIEGVARGLSKTGGLLLDVDGEVKHYESGELSLRILTGSGQSEINGPP